MYRIKRSVLYRRPVQWVLDLLGIISPDNYSVSSTKEQAERKMESIKDAYFSAVCQWHFKHVLIHTVTKNIYDRDKGVFMVLLKSGTPVITFRIKEEKNE